MNFFKKLFGHKSKENTSYNNPENSRLLFLIDIWVQESSYKNYCAVVQELAEGNSILIFSSQNSMSSPTGWYKTEKSTTLKLTSLVEKDGLWILRAFTDKEFLLAWKKQPMFYSS